MQIKLYIDEDGLYDALRDYLIRNVEVEGPIEPHINAVISILKERIFNRIEGKLVSKKGESKSIDEVIWKPVREQTIMNKLSELEKDNVDLQERVSDLEKQISSIEGNVNFLYTADDY